MATSQHFINAYKISSLTAGAGTSFNITVQTNGAKTNVTITDTASTVPGVVDSTAILGDIGLPTTTAPTLGDEVTASGLNNTSSTYYFGAAVVGGVTGMVVYDQQGSNYWFIANATIANGATGSGTVASPTGQTWTLAGTGTPAAPAITGITDDAAPNTGNVAKGGSTNDTTPTLTGTAGAGELITIKDGAATLGTAIANAAGAWSFTTAAQSEGTHSYTATATNGTGTSAASAAYSATIDTTAPSAPTIGSAVDDAGTVTGSVLSGGVTDDTTPTLVVTLPVNAVAGDTVSILNGTTQVGSRVLVAADITAGKVSITTAAVTGDGAKTLTATVTDAAGNASAAGSFSYTLDTTAPTATTTIALVADTGTAGDGITSAPALAGKSSVAGAGQTVTIKDGATVVGTATTAADGSWTFANASAGEGAHSYTAAVTDLAGNSGTATATTPAGTTVDTTAPTATTTIALASDTGTAGDGITSDPALAGKSSVAAAGQTVTIKDGATVVGTATTAADGSWTFANAGASQSAHSYTAAVTDLAGNSGAFTATAPASTTLDTAAPAAPTVGSVSDNVGAIQGTLASGAATDDTTLTLSGTAEAGSTVNVYNGATLVGTATATGGSWTVTTAALSDGPVSLTARATDAAGNAGAASTAFTATVDTAAPTVAAAASTAGTFHVGDQATFTLTTSEAVSVTGTPTLTLSNGATATYDAAGSTATALAFKYTVAAGQADSADLAVTAVNGTIKDAAGNSLAAYAGNPAGTTAVDANAPTVSSVAYGANDGALAAGETVTLNVAFSEAVTVAGGTPTLALNSGGTATYAGGSGTGTLSFTYTPAAGQTAADLAVTAFNLNGATVKDAAGNAANTAAAAANPAGTLAVDTAAPAAPAIGSVTDNVGAAQGTLANGAATDDATLTLAGTAEAGAAVKVFNGATQVAAATADAAGNWTATTAALADGAVSLTARATDAAGNAGAASAAFAATVDTAAPAAPAGVALASDTGASAADGITADPTIAGTAEAGATITLKVGTATVGTGTADGSGHFSITPTGLADGAATVSVTATDAAGNTGAAASLLFTLDRTAPTATTTVALAHDTGAAGDGISSDPALAGKSSVAAAGQTVTIKDGAAVVGTATTAADGSWSFANASAGEGAHSYTAAVTDAAGNSGAATATTPAGTTVDTTAPATTATIALASDTGAAGDGTTSAPALAGTAPADATIVIKDGGTVVGTAVADGTGAWSFANAGALDGAHSWTAQVADAAGNLGPASGAVSATLDRAPDADVSVRLVDAAAGPGGAAVSLDLSGLDAGSTAEVTFTGAGGGSVVRSFTANGAATADVSGLRGDLTAAVQVVDAAGNQAAGQGGTLAADPVCFYPGTLVAVPGGAAAVETLRAGDLVLTADGRAAPVRWLGRQTVSTRFADPLRVLPVRITAGALGDNLPERDLLVSPDHALLLDGVLVQAGALVNGGTIRREAGVPEVFTYWHVELAGHALVLAEGVPAESFIDNVARLAFDNWAEHEAAADPAPMAEMELPRAKAHRQVPAATRLRLAERAALLLGAAAAA